MKTIYYALCLIPLLCATCSVTAQDQLTDCIIKISSKGSVENTGAGLIIGFDKSSKLTVFAATAYHVVEDADVIEVNFRQSWRKYEAEIFRYEEESDLAIVKFEIPAVYSQLLINLQRSKEGSATTLDRITAIGHPAGNYWTTNSSNAIESILSNKINITANGILEGYSGGGIFNLNGQVLGMLTHVRTVDAQTIRIEYILSQANHWGVPTNLIINPKMNLTWAVIGGAGIMKLGVGAYFKRKSNSNYEIYSNHRFTDDPVYEGTTREDVFETAKQQNTAAVVCGAIGAGLLITSAVLLLKEMNSKKRTKNLEGYSLIPQMDVGGLVVSKGQQVQMGFRMQF